MRRISVVTIVLALLVGVGTAWWGVPWLRLELALRSITAAEPNRRADAWRTLSRSEAGGESVAARRLDRINERVREADAEALLDASDALHTLHLWGWSHQPATLVLRELDIRLSAPDTGQHLLVVDAMRSCPLDVEPQSVGPLLQRLLEHDTASIRTGGWEAAAAWAGRVRNDWLATLNVPPNDVDLRRRRELALGVCERETEPDVEAWLAMPPDLAEGVLMRSALATPSEIGPLIETAERWSNGERPGFAAIVRYASDSRASETLRRWEDDGDRAAGFALQARSKQREQEAASRVASDPGQPAWRRRLAAWRWDKIPRERVDDILALDPVEPDGSVYAAALLAERKLPPGDAAALAEDWIRDLDNHRKRAGAMLSALLGVHASLLEEACDGEDVADVRTTQRLAIAALGRTTSPAELEELAHRALRRGTDGDIDPDVVCAVLAAGRPSGIPHLVTTPPEGWRNGGRAAQARSWLIERFVPSWHERFGRPLGSLRELELHFDLLRECVVLSERRLAFDPGTGTFGEGTEGLNRAVFLNPEP